MAGKVKIHGHCDNKFAPVKKAFASNFEAVYYVLSAVTLLITSVVMLRSNVFSKTIAYLGILAGVLMLVPSTAGTVGLTLALASLVPFAIWLVLFARRLFQLGQGVSAKKAFRS
jgi:hypothetical protein